MDILKMGPASGQPSTSYPVKYQYSASVDTDFVCQLPRMIKDGVFGLTRYIGKNLRLIL